MKRVLEFVPSDHDIVVSRVLVLVHQAIDSEFPEAKPASQRFAKTAFGDEPTLTKSHPGEITRGIISDESPIKKITLEDTTSDEKTLSEMKSAPR